MNNLKPFFCFYGGKWRSAPQYPQPQHPMIIEPFAGAAGYATRHHHLQVKLYDADPVVCGVWDFLIRASEHEIRKLPLDIEDVRDLNVPQEAKWMIGFWLNKGCSGPRLTPSSWMRSGSRPHSYWGETIRNRIASQVTCIKHWTVENRPYSEVPEHSGCWFVDPPYKGSSGRIYRHNHIDYKLLAEWCRNRNGQIMVCEMNGADWLPFRPHVKAHSNPSCRGKLYCPEVLWTNNDHIHPQREQ